MPRFLPFNRKKTGAPKVKLWNAHLESKVEPSALALGEVAQHHIVFHNFDVAKYVLTLDFKCDGQLLRYEPPTKPESITCEAQTRMEPAHTARVHLPANTSANALPAVGHIKVEFTAELPGHSPTKDSREHALQLRKGP